LSEASNPVLRHDPEGFLKIYLERPKSEADALESEVRVLRERRSALGSGSERSGSDACALG
jgi:hypothetical protein